MNWKWAAGAGAVVVLLVIVWAWWSSRASADAAPLGAGGRPTGGGALPEGASAVRARARELSGAIMNGDVKGEPNRP